MTDDVESLSRELDIADTYGAIRIVAIKAIRLAQALTSRPQEWMPIETAPRDGTVILVCEAHSYPVTARCYPNYYHSFDGNREAWLVTSEGRNMDDMDGVAVKVEPTHWQPLPQPPKTRPRMDEVRAMFESVASEEFGLDTYRNTVHPDMYQAMPTQWAWQGYQAATSQAQEELTRLRAENERLRGALKEIERWGVSTTIYPGARAQQSSWAPSEASKIATRALTPPKEPTDG